MLIQVVGVKQPVTFSMSNSHRQDLLNRLWVVGAGAADFRTAQYLANNDSKLSHALQLVLSNLVLPENGGSLSLHKLILFLPEIAKEGSQLIDDVQGTHMFRLNGETYTVEIPRSAIEVYQEGAGVAHFCRERALVPEDQVIGVVDVGGGTLIGTLFNAEGDLINESRRIASPENRSGVYSGLAANIAQHPFFTQNGYASPDLKVLVKAISQAEYEVVQSPEKKDILVPKQPLMYGQSNFDFTSVFVEINDEWCRKALKEIWNAWSPWHPVIGKIAVCGGGAPLLGAIVNSPKLAGINKYFIPNDPGFPKTSQIANVVGGWGLGSVDGISGRTLSDDLMEVIQLNSTADTLAKGKRK